MCKDEESFLAKGNLATLATAVIYLEICFAAWNLIGPLQIFIRHALSFSHSQLGAISSVAILSGALLRLPVGGLADVIGPRKTGLMLLLLLIPSLILTWICVPSSFTSMLLFAFALGTGGATFAAAIPLVSQWYSHRWQGTALGIVGAGNSGVAISSLFAPALAERLEGVCGRPGWLNVVGLLILPLLLTLLLYLACAKDGPFRHPPSSFKAWGTVLKNKDSWILMFFYAISFGGFVSLSFFLTLYFHEQYHLSPKIAGIYAGILSIISSFVRPVGGGIADKIGGVLPLILLFAITGALFFIFTLNVPLLAGFLILALGMFTLGLANGAIFRLVPLRFPKQVGIITGVVGAAGGVGGAAMTALLGVIKESTDSYKAGFLGFSAISLCAVLLAFYCAKLWHIDLLRPSTTKNIIPSE